MSEVADVNLPVTDGFVVEKSPVVHELKVDLLGFVDRSLEASLFAVPFGVVAFLVNELPVLFIVIDLEVSLDLVSRDAFTFYVDTQEGKNEVT